MRSWIPGDGKNDAAVMVGLSIQDQVLILQKKCETCSIMLSFGRDSQNSRMYDVRGVSQGEFRDIRQCIHRRDSEYLF